MSKIGKIFEIGYLVMAVLLGYEAYARWNTDRNTSYIAIFFVCLAIFMFFFRKKMRKRREEYLNKNK
ncbi:hypothetical protein [Urechidicola croceus]|uniref:Uncharacterized protein n=1 Tax=Urechidicola croceus TaxID=1850246 RepID=A0A1D8P784_9FLAO|nr:hypothetical protein [Urechidicola croceus]AOW20414.1 hypothetical protein LPB138_06885 [Urechidicola croceus]